MMSLDAWMAATAGEVVNVDSLYGGQCWDLWSHYATEVVGVPYVLTVTRAGGIDPHPGYACNVWHNAEQAGLGRYFELLPPKSAARRGDVALWDRSPTWPGSHVAIVLADHGDRLTTWTQNPNLPAARVLPKASLLGYLRPRPTKATDREDDDMTDEERQMLREVHAWTSGLARGVYPREGDVAEQLQAAAQAAVLVAPVGGSPHRAIDVLTSHAPATLLAVRRLLERAGVDADTIAAELRDAGLADDIVDAMAERLAERPTPPEG